MRRALVTGCAGFIGSHLTESLLDDGVEVLGVDCFNNNYGRSDKLANLSHAHEWQNFQFVPLDLAAGHLDLLVEECDIVFHLAAEPGVRSSWTERFDLYIRNNVLATHHLLTSLAAHPGRRMVFASSSSVYGQADTLPTAETATPRPSSPYGVTKLTGEQLCAAYRDTGGLDFVGLRFFSVYGPRQRPDMAFRRFCDAALSDEKITIYGDGRQTRDFTYVADVVRAARLAATADDRAAGRLLNVGGGSSASLVDAIDLLDEIHGRRLRRQHVSQQRGDVKDTAADTRLVRDVLNFSPATTLADGLRAQYEWCHDARN